MVTEKQTPIAKKKSEEDAKKKLKAASKRRSQALKKKREEKKIEKKDKVQKKIDQVQIAIKDTSDLSTNRNLSKLILTETAQNSIEFEKNYRFENGEYDKITHLINDLEQKIHATDQEAKILGAKIKEFEKITNKSTSHKTQLKDLILKEQNKIFKMENVLLDVDPDQYHADLPFYTKIFLSILDNRPDEINLKTEIIQSETKIKQRELRLVKVSRQLAQSAIGLTFYQDCLEATIKVGETYRARRSEFGSFRRKFIDDFKEQKNENETNFILKEYSKSLVSLGEIGSRFQQALIESGASASNLFEEIRESQNQNLLNSSKKLDDIANSLLKNKK